MDYKKEAENLLISWNEYLYKIGFKHKKAGYNAHKDIKRLIKEPINDKELIKELCEQAIDFFFLTKVRILDFCSEELKNDREIILTVLQAYGDNLALLSPKLQDDTEIVLAAVGSTDALQYASERLRDDDIVVILSLITDPETIEFASDRFRNDRELSLQLVKKHHYMFDKISIEFKNDPTFISEYWEHIKECYSSSIQMDNYILRILNNIGDKLKPYFKDINLNDGSANLVKEFETYLNLAVLNKELNNEQSISKKKNKKPKL
jgi:hypothetical protein